MHLNIWRPGSHRPSVRINTESRLMSLTCWHHWLSPNQQNQQQQQQQPFYGPLSRTTWASRYQKKHSSTHHPDHHPIFISFFHLPWSTASSLFKLHAWQSFCTTSFHVQHQSIQRKLCRIFANNHAKQKKQRCNENWLHDPSHSHVPALDVRCTNEYLSIKTTGPHQCRVQNIDTVCRSKNDDVGLRSETCNKSK